MSNSGAEGQDANDSDEPVSVAPSNGFVGNRARSHTTGGEIGGSSGSEDNATDELSTSGQQTVAAPDRPLRKTIFGRLKTSTPALPVDSTSSAAQGAATGVGGNTNAAAALSSVPSAASLAVPGAVSVGGTGAGGAAGAGSDKPTLSRESGASTSGGALRGSRKEKHQSGKVGYDWKKALKRFTGQHNNASSNALPGAGGMPSEADVLAQFDAFVFQRGLESQRGQFDSLPLETKWNMVREHMAESTDVAKVKQKGKKDPAKMVSKLQNDPSPATCEALRVLLSSEPLSYLVKFLEANGVHVLLATITVFEGKAKKTTSDQEVLFDLITAVRSVLQYPQGLSAILDAHGPLSLVGCFDPAFELTVRGAAVNALKHVAMGSPQGCTQVYSAWNAYSKTRAERMRYEQLVNQVQTSPDWSFRVNICAMLMAMVVGLADRTQRLALKQDLLQAGFKTLLAELAEDEDVPEDLQQQFSEFVAEFRRSQVRDGTALFPDSGEGSTGTGGGDSSAESTADGTLSTTATIASSEVEVVGSTSGAGRKRSKSGEGVPLGAAPLFEEVKPPRHRSSSAGSSPALDLLVASAIAPSPAAADLIGGGRPRSASIDKQRDSSSPGRSATPSADSKRDATQLGSLLDQVVSETSVDPQIAGVCRSVLENLVRGFGKSAESLWQWQCAARLTQTLASLPHQMHGADFEQDTFSKNSPEMVLTDLLLGGVVQDHMFELRSEVHRLREELSSLTKASTVTIRDLQIQLEEQSKKKPSKGRTKRHQKNSLHGALQNVAATLAAQEQAERKSSDESAASPNSFGAAPSSIAPVPAGAPNVTLQSASGGSFASHLTLPATPVPSPAPIRSSGYLTTAAPNEPPALVLTTSFDVGDDNPILSPKAVRAVDDDDDDATLTPRKDGGGSATPSLSSKDGTSTPSKDTGSSTPTKEAGSLTPSTATKMHKKRTMKRKKVVKKSGSKLDRSISSSGLPNAADNGGGLVSPGRSSVGDYESSGANALSGSSANIVMNEESSGEE